MSFRLFGKVFLKEVGFELSFKGRLEYRWGECKGCLLKVGGMKVIKIRKCMCI